MAPLSVQEISLSTNEWHWKEVSRSKTEYTDWHKCVTFPTVIHHELEEAKLIADPFVDDNERSIQWVGWKDWSFKTSFPTPDHADEYAHAILAFDGLDTVAKVFLNGDVILESDNMFIPYRIDVKGRLKSKDEENELHIVFASNDRVGNERMEKYGKEYKGVSNTRDPARVWMRKAQFHWGWDWGMRTVSLGLYQMKLTAYIRPGGGDGRTIQGHSTGDI